MAGKQIKKSGFEHGEASPKIFVFDTNIILHDPGAINHFQDNEVRIPITVIEELDKFKKGDDNLGYNARVFLRNIDRLTAGLSGEKGFGKTRSKVQIELGHGFGPQLQDSLIDDTPDHRIIATALWLRDQNPDRRVILVSKDINMRLKAKSLGLLVQDYLSDRVDESRIEKSERELIVLRKLSDESVGPLLSGGRLPIARLGLKRRPRANQSYRLETLSGEKLLARYDASLNALVRVEHRRVCGISSRNDDQAFAIEAILNPDIQIVALTGRDGSGKTLLALAAALEQAASYGKILVSRPVIALNGKYPSLFSGSTKDRIAACLQPIYDNLAYIKSRVDHSTEAKIDALISSGTLQISALTYVRGRSLAKTLFIVDEAQNLSPNEIKVLIGAAGDKTKLVFTGDIYRVDQPYLDMQSNGLTHICDKLSGQPVFRHVHLSKSEKSGLAALAERYL